MANDDAKIKDAGIDALAAFMAGRGLVATSWARAAGLGINTVTEILKGKSPQLLTLQKLAKAANVTIGEMLGETAPQPAATVPLDPDLLANVIQAVEERNLSLTPADKAALIATLYQMARKDRQIDDDTVSLLAKLATRAG